MEFVDRRDAGRRLATQLLALAQERPVVIALPRGGVPVAFEVARALDAPLDVLAVRKLGAPGNPEFGVGAIAEDGTALLNAATATRVGMTQRDLELTVERELRELRRRVERYRDGRAPLDLRDRTVIVVDDGLATGLTDLAAVRALRTRGAARIVVAVPVGAREAVALVGEEADDVVCHTIPHELLGQASRSDVPVEPAPAPQHIPIDGPPASRQLDLNIGGVALSGDLTLPERSQGLVIFAHGSGSSRLSPRNRAVAAA
ncbi:MAG: phosphoribosyltransferase, partial [Solirubrobacteraceae bacterium]